MVVFTPGMVTEEKAWKMWGTSEPSAWHREAAENRAPTSAGEEGRMDQCDSDAPNRHGPVAGQSGGAGSACAGPEPGRRVHAHGTFTGSAFRHAYGCAAEFSADRARDGRDGGQRGRRSSTGHRHQVRRGERIVCKMRNSPRRWKTDRFLKEFVSLNEATARWLVDRRVPTVGIDYLSIAGASRTRRRSIRSCSREAFGSSRA
jgi:hypothetical protein